MSDFRQFPAAGVDVMSLARALAGWLQQQQFEVQSIALADGIQVQARQVGGLRKFTGTSSALNVNIRQAGQNLNVDVGPGQWGDKAAAGAVGMFLLWPLAFTAAYGAWQQNKLPDRMFDFITRYIATGGAGDPLAFAAAPGQGYALPSQVYPTPPAAVPPPVAAAAPAVAAAAPVAAAPVAAAPAAAPTACSSCGAGLPAGSVFCMRCGTRVG